MQRLKPLASTACCLLPAACCLLLLTPDHVGGLLGDHDGGGVGVAAGDEGHDGGIDDA